jgi:hypothetical protein
MTKTTDELAAELDALRATVRTLQYQNQAALGKICAMGVFIMALVEERARQQKRPLQWLSVFADKVRNIARLIQLIPNKTDPVSRAVIRTEIDGTVHDLMGTLIATFSADAVKAAEGLTAKAPRWVPRFVDADSERPH